MARPPASDRPPNQQESVPLLARASRGSDTGTAIALIDAALAQLPSDDPARIGLAARRARLLLTVDRNAEAVERASALLPDTTDLATRLHLTSTIALATFALGDPPIELRPIEEWLDDQQPDAHLDLDTRLALADYAVVQVASGDVVEGARTARLAHDGADDEVLDVIAGIASTTAALHMGHTADAIKGADQLADALERCHRLPEVAGYAPWITLGLVSNYRGDADRAIATLERGHEVMRTVGLDWLTGVSGAVTASVLLDAGRWDLALAAVASVETASIRSGNVSFLPMALAVRAVIEARRGDVDAAARTIELAELAAPRPFNGEDHLVRARSALASARQEWAAAVTPFVDLAARDDAMGIATWAPAILLDALLAADDAGDPTRLRAFARRAPVDHPGTAATTASTRAAAALAGNDLAQLWTAAAGFAGVLPHQSARLVAAAVARSAIPDPAQSDAAGHAQAVLDQMGATTDADRLRRALATSGAGHHARSGSGAWTQLTPAEQRVSRLVAEGLSNREVADRLRLSTRTVEAHLRSIFAKLDVPSRLRLAVLVKDLGPSDPDVPLGGTTDDSEGAPS